MCTATASRCRNDRAGGLKFIFVSLFRGEKPLHKLQFSKVGWYNSRYAELLVVSVSFGYMDMSLSRYGDYPFSQVLYKFARNTFRHDNVLEIGTSFHPRAL